MPTTVVKSIGTGRDYSTIGAWEADTDNDLVTDDEIQQGDIYDDKDYNEAIPIAGATTDSDHFRALRAATGHNYRPDLDTGIRIWEDVRRTNGTISINENYSNVRRVLIESLYTGSLGSQVLRCVNTGTYYRACVVALQEIGNASFARFGTALNTGEKGFRSCIGIGNVGSDPEQGANQGWTIAGGLCYAYHCAAYGVDTDPASGVEGVGFWDAGNTNTHRSLINCWAFDCGDKDWDFAVLGNFLENNAGSDGSMTGQVKSFPNLTPADEIAETFTKRPFNFRPLLTSTLLNNGKVLGSSFNGSMSQSNPHETRVSGKRSIGPYDAAYARQSLSATVDLSAARTVKVGKVLAASVEASTTLTRKTRKALAATVDASATVSKRTKKLLPDAAVGASAAVSKKTRKALADAGVGVSAALSKKTRKVLSAGVTLASSLVAIKQGGGPPAFRLVTSQVARFARTCRRTMDFAVRPGRTARFAGIARVAFFAAVRAATARFRVVLDPVALVRRTLSAVTKHVRTYREGVSSLREQPRTFAITRREERVFSRVRALTARLARTLSVSRLFRRIMKKDSEH